MPKPPYYRIFLKEGSKTYLLCRLMQQKSDESLMLQVEPSKAGGSATVGKIEITGDTFEINYEQIDTPADIEHTSIHASGMSHTKLKDGTYRFNYDKDNAGIPLAELKTIKHLGTLLSREMTEADIKPAERLTDVAIERNTGQKFSVLDILAVPKGINFNFSADWDMENDRPVQLNVGMHRLSFNSFDAIIFTRSSDQFDEVPKKTLHLPDMNNIVPFVTRLNGTQAVIKLSSLTFDEVLKPQDPNDPYAGFTVISATPKWL